MRMLELVRQVTPARSTSSPVGYRKHNKRRVFDDWEVGALPDGLAQWLAPAVSGLDEGPFTLEMYDDDHRYERSKQSRLSSTALAEAIIAGI